MRRGKPGSRILWLVEESRSPGVDQRVLVHVAVSEHSPDPDLSGSDRAGVVFTGHVHFCPSHPGDEPADSPACAQRVERFVSLLRIHPAFQVLVTRGRRTTHVTVRFRYHCELEKSRYCEQIQWLLEISRRAHPDRSRALG